MSGDLSGTGSGAFWSERYSAAVTNEEEDSSSVRESCGFPVIRRGAEGRLSRSVQKVFGVGVVAGFEIMAWTTSMSCQRDRKYAYRPGNRL